MTRTLVAKPMSTNNDGDGRIIASLAVGLGLWGSILGILNIISGIGGSPEQKLKVVWAAYLSMGQLYPDLYTSDMVFRPWSDSVFMLLNLGLFGWGAKCLHESTEGGFSSWVKSIFTCHCWLSLMSTREAGPQMTAAMWCIVLGLGFYIYQSITHWNWVDVGVYSVTASLLGFGAALWFAASSETDHDSMY